MSITLDQKAKTMKPKDLFLTIAALLAAGGLWSAWRAHALHKASMGVGFQKPYEQSLQRGGQPHAEDAAPMGMSQTQANRGASGGGSPQPDQMLQPPIPNRRFTDFTPEQRVEFARRGRGPGG